MAASLWPVLDMRCVADYVEWIAGNSKMPYETGFIIVPKIIDASLPFQPLSLGDGASLHAHAGLTFQSNDLFVCHTSLVCHPTSPALAPQTSNMKALPPGGYSKPGGRAISSAGLKVQPLAVRIQMQPAALPPGAYSKPGGRAIFSAGFKVQPQAVRIQMQPAALPPGTYSKPGGRAISSAGLKVQPLAVRIQMQPAALPPGTYSKPGGRAISSAGFKVQPLAVRIQMQPAALPPGTYSKLGGRAISSAEFKVQPLAVRIQMQPAALPPGACSKPGGRAISSDYNHTLRSSQLCEIHFLLCLCYMQQCALILCIMVCKTVSSSCMSLLY